MSDEQIGEFARQLAQARYGAIWLGSASADLRSAEPILFATSGLVYATGILNVWTEPAEQVVASCRRLSAYSDRVLAGIGARHPERPDNKQYARPYASLVAYPGALAEIPAEHLALAAGPKGARASRQAHRGCAPVLHHARADPAGQADPRRCDGPDAGQLRRAIAAAIGAFGRPGSGQRVAQELGDHPETAVIRMRWARIMARAAFADSALEPGPRPDAHPWPGARSRLPAEETSGSGKPDGASEQDP